MQALLSGGGGRVVLAFLVYLQLYALWQINHWGGDDLKPLIADSWILPIELIAVMLAWRTSRHPAIDRNVARAWLILGAAFGARFIGDLFFLVYEAVLRVDPFPSPADIGYLAFYPLALWGLLTFPRIMRSKEERVRFWLDVATVVVGGGHGSVALRHPALLVDH